MSCWSSLRDAGVDVQMYRPLKWYHLGRLNNRTHRKLLIVDGRVGFTGGVGIADQWQGHAQDPDHWRDVHFRVEGPAVAQMQAAFNDNWIKITGEVLNGQRLFPRACAGRRRPTRTCSSLRPPGAAKACTSCT